MAADVLVVEEGEFNVAVSSQTVTSDGLLIAFDSGASVLLQGVTAALPDASILFVDDAGLASGDAPSPAADEETPDMPEVAEDMVAAGVTTTFDGTDDAETVAAPGPVQALSADLAGGNDEATGDALNDTIAGADGADNLAGAAGDDILFSTAADSAAASDADVDTLAGGAGDDVLVLGNGDEATGGDGADSFALRPDVTDTVTIGDFDAAEDILIVEARDPTDVTLLDQTSGPDGLVIRFNTGADILLLGQTDPIDPALIRIELPGTSTSA